MDHTDQYYERFAAEFFGSTVGVDMAPIHQRFLARLPARAHILDAGCGSGRDAKAFAEAGFQVTAFDASAELARLASTYCGFEVAVRRFEEVDDVDAFDGIWCCASLLHVPLAAMPATLDRLWRALRPGGTLYLSFKHGTGERSHGGRRFTDADEATLRQWIGRWPDVHQLDLWLTNDQRPDRTERWTNALATRKPAPSQRLVTGGADHFLPHLSEAFTWATQADLAVAFIKTTGLRLLLPDLESMVEAGAPQRVRVLTSDYLDITDPEALRLLLLLQERGAEVRVYTTQEGSFHLKATSSPGWTGSCSRQELPSSAPATSAGRRFRTGWSGTIGSSTPATPASSKPAVASRNCSVTRRPWRCPMPGSRLMNSGGFRPRDRSRPAAMSRKRHPSPRRSSTKRWRH
jgi:SAM-dependent methyltransferase